MDNAGMSDAELTLLSMLAEADRYDHEIQQIVEDRGLRSWVPIGFSSIYYLLNKLEEQNMIASEMRPTAQGSPRKFYHITDAGRGILQTAIAERLRQPRTLGTGFELGLVNLNVLKPQQVYQTLGHHRADLRTRLKRIESDWQQYQAESDAVETTDTISALYTHSIAVMQAELDWLETFLNDWLARYPGAERPPTHPVKPPDESHSAQTKLNRRPTPDPAKMIQKLKRPPKEE